MKYLMRKHSYLILAFIPLICLIFFVVKYKPPFPVQDQWDLVPLLEKSYQGILSFPDLWQQHNEHRPFFPRIIMIILARLSGWNISYELAVNILLALGIFMAIVYQIKITAKSVKGLKIKWIIPIVSLMVFSLSQWENWFCGWQMQIFLNILAVVIGIALLSNPVFKWSYFWLALFLGIVATYSFATGLAYWPIGLLILFFHRKIMKSSVILWALAGFMIIYSYLYQYHKPPHIPSYGVILQEPLAYIKYVLGYLGAPLVSFSNEGAFLFGLLGLMVPLYTSWLSLWLRHINFRILIPYISLNLYAISSALMTSIGRAGFETRQALSSRYITTSSLFWISNLIFLFLLSSGDRDTVERASKARLKKYILFYPIKIIVFLLILNSVYGSIIAIRRYYSLPPVDMLLSGNYDTILRRSFGMDMDKVKEYQATLDKLHLSVFRGRE